MSKVKPHSVKKTNQVNAAVILQRLTERLAHTPPVRRSRACPKGALIEQLREPLQALRREHQCSLPLLVELLKECGFQIHLSTLKRYLGPTDAARPASPTGAPAVDAPMPRPASSTGAPAVISPRASRVDPSDAVVPVVTPAPTPAAGAVPSRHEVTPSRLHLASRFTPKPEVPYPELIRQAAARKQSQDTTPASDDTPGSSDPPTSTA